MQPPLPKVMLPALVLLSTASAAAPVGTQPFEPFTLSNTLGDGMVLQRAPESSMVWGFGAAGTTISTTFMGKRLTTKAGADGIWRQKLPPTEATKVPTTITFKSGATSLSLKSVVFGDVFLCGGQSNMQYTPHSMAGMNNLTAELSAADAYPDIRFFTVGQKNQSTVPFNQLASIEYPWAPASAATLGGTAWKEFSAVCWLFGRDIHDALGGNVPIGLISNNWGGTPVQSWSSAKALSKCNGGKLGAGGNLYGAMIHPYTVGPMSLKGFTWYQGEANVGQAAFYACQFPAMIEGWREDFQSEGASNPLWFGFVQIAGWNYGNGTRSLAAGDLRQAQLAALKLDNVGLSTAIDTGDFINIHPPDKQIPGSRLAKQALEMIYQKPGLNSAFPLYSGAKLAINNAAVSVTVSFTNVGAGGLTTTAPLYATQSSTLGKPTSVARNVCVADVAAFKGKSGVDDSSCGFPRIIGADGTSLKAEAVLSADKQGIVLSLAAAPAGFKPVATSYGRGSWPVTTFFNAFGQPVIPWYANITAMEMPTVDFSWSVHAPEAAKLAGKAEDFVQ